MITLGVGFFTTFHVIGNQQQHNENDQDRLLPCENDEIPYSLYFLLFLLTLVSIFPYIKNTALRLFAVTFIKKQSFLFLGIKPKKKIHC